MGAVRREVEHAVLATRGDVLLLEGLVGAQREALQELGVEQVARAHPGIEFRRLAVAAEDPDARVVGDQLVDVDHRVVALPRAVGVLGLAPHVVGVVATRVTHRDVDQHRPPALGQVQEARQRAGVLEHLRVVDRHRQRGRTGHRQAHGRVAVRVDTLVGRQVGRQLLGDEGLPLVGLAAVVAAGRAVPVAVEAGLPADRHDHGHARVQVPLEGGGVDVPAVEVVLRTQTVEQVHAGCVGPAALELHLDVTAHACRRHHQVLHGQTGTGERSRSRCATDGGDQAGQQRGRQGRHRDPTPRHLRCAAQPPNELHGCMSFPSFVKQQLAGPGVAQAPGLVARVVNHTFVVTSPHRGAASRHRAAFRSVRSGRSYVLIRATWRQRYESRKPSPPTNRARQRPAHGPVAGSPV